MKKLLLLILMIFMGFTCFAGSVYVMDSGKPDLVIWIAPYKSQADLCVYVAPYRSEARGKDEIWYFEKYRSSADIKIKITKYESQADLKIYYLKYKSEAGWRKSHPWMGRLH